VAAALIAATALAGKTDRAEFQLGLAAKRAGVPTATQIHVLLKDPDDPDAKPPALKGGVIMLPHGMRVDNDAVPKCTATDNDFQAQGRDACPEETQVGAGTLKVMMGLPPDPEELDIVAFNGDRHLVEVVFFKDTNAVAGIDRVEIRRDRLVPHPPIPPGGPPDGKTAIRELLLDIPRRVEPAGAYVTTPRRCRTGRWRSQATLEFADGGSTTVSSTTPCRRPRRR
jgi:hypothetical protein